MFPNLKGELAKRDITLEKLAPVVDVSISTLSQKLNGKYPLTFAEAKKIKDYIGTSLSLEDLFSEEAQ